MDDLDRRLIKREYKETLQPAGAYQIRNLVNGKILVGVSPNLPAKKNSFQISLIGTYNEDLKREVKEYGPEKFVFEVLEELDFTDGPPADLKEELKRLEAVWLERLQPYGEKGYNRPPKE